MCRKWDVGGHASATSFLAFASPTTPTPTLPQGREHCFAATEPRSLGTAWGLIGRLRRGGGCREWAVGKIKLRIWHTARNLADRLLRTKTCILPPTPRPLPPAFSRIPGRTREADETREPALNLIQDPCCTESRNCVVVDIPATGYKPPTTSRLCPYPRTTEAISRGRSGVHAGREAEIRLPLTDPLQATGHRACITTYYAPIRADTLVRCVKWATHRLSRPAPAKI